MNKQEFIQDFRAKTGAAYDDMSDDQLFTAISAKKPELIKDVKEETTTDFVKENAPKVFPSALKSAAKAAITPLTGTTIAELMKNPTVNDFGGGLVQGATYGIGKPVMKYAGIDVPQPKSKAASMAGEITGAALSPISKIGFGIKGAGTLATLAKGAIHGAAYNPSDENIAGIDKRVSGGVAGVAGGGLGKLSGAIIEGKNPVSLMKIALQGRKWDKKFSEDVERAMPIIDKVAKETETPLNSLRNLSDVVDTAKKSVYEKYQKLRDIAGDSAEGLIDGDKIAMKINESISQYTQRVYPEIADKVAQYAQKFRGKLTLQEADALLEGMNKESSAWYKKTAAGQYASGDNDMLQATLEGAKAVRDELYGTIDRLMEKTSKGHYEQGMARELKRDVGALMNISHTLSGRINVAERQAVVGLPEMLALSDSAIDMVRNPFSTLAKLAAAKYLRNHNNPDYLTEQAFRRFNKKPPTGPGNTALISTILTNKENNK